MTTITRKVFEKIDWIACKQQKIQRNHFCVHRKPDQSEKPTYAVFLFKEIIIRLNEFVSCGFHCFLNKQMRL